jgi:hypothetical protein
MSIYQIILKEGEDTFPFDITSEEFKMLKDFFGRYSTRPIQRKSKLRNLQSYI